jgi:hypothetical protein
MGDVREVHARSFNSVPLKCLQIKVVIQIKNVTDFRTIRYVDICIFVGALPVRIH